ncbi:unnamed protein product, partial [Effrenium voratum]
GFDPWPCVSSGFDGRMAACAGLGAVCRRCPTRRLLPLGAPGLLPHRRAAPGRQGRQGSPEAFGSAEETQQLRSQTLTVEISVKDSKLAAKLLSGDWAAGVLGEAARERLSLRGPLSSKPFVSGARDVEVSLPLGRWATWRLRERSAQAADWLECGEGGMTWSMAVALANHLGALPEYPRLRVLELGAGTGLASLALSGRGHEAVASDGGPCLRNLRRNLGPRAEVRQFRWHVEEDRAELSRGAFDLVVGSDLLRDNQHCDALRAALGPLLRVSPEVWLMERNSPAAADCLEALRSWQVTVQWGGSGRAVVDGQKDPAQLLSDAAAAMLIRVSSLQLSMSNG